MTAFIKGPSAKTKDSKSLLSSPRRRQAESQWSPSARSYSPNRRGNGKSSEHFQNVVATLLNKGRELRKDMTRLLLEDGTPQKETETREENRILSAADALSSLWEVNAQRTVDINRAAVDLVLGDGLTKDEFNAVTAAVDRSSTFISSDDDDLSETEDPIHDESILDGLFYDGMKPIEVVPTTNVIKSPPPSATKQKPMRLNPASSRLENAGGSPHKRVTFLSNASRTSARRKPSTTSLRETKAPRTGQSKEITKSSLSVKGSAIPKVSTDNSGIKKPMILHCIIMIPVGTGFLWSVRPRYSHAGCRERNVYLVCRMFWSDDTVRSNVCWNACNPEFNFLQVAPVEVTESLLKRMQDNIMVIEIWEKRLPPKSDELIGICKLSLHLFYLAFRDANVASTFLQSQKPVVAVNGDVPVTDVFSGRKVGQLSVLLAMGTSDQVEDFRRQPFVQQSTVAAAETLEVHHTFEMSVKLLKLDEPPGCTIWGESNCYIHYLFPKSGATNEADIGDINLNPYRIGPQLCEPIVKFKDYVIHTLIQPSGNLLQKSLQNAFPREGLPLQLWCRYYYPTECDELVAEAYLPISKLLSLISQSKDDFSAVDNFVLHLAPFEKFSNFGKDLKIGFVEMQIKYTKQSKPTKASLVACKEEENKGLSGSVNKSFNEKDIELYSMEISNRNKARPPPDSERQRQSTKVAVEPPTDHRKPTVSTVISVERGNNLSTENLSLISHDNFLDCCVSMPFAESSQELITNIAPLTASPIWNWEGEVAIPVEKLLRAIKILVFKVWAVHNSETDFRNSNNRSLIGNLTVDLVPLFVGLEHLSGWYNILDYEGKCRGQVKISISPLTPLSLLGEQPPKFLKAEGHLERKYLTAGLYEQFPCHVAQFTEQTLEYAAVSDTIWKKNNDEEKRIDGASSQPSTDASPEMSRSMLLNDLSEKLSEIERLRDTMKQWLQLNSDNDTKGVTDGSHVVHQEQSDSRRFEMGDPGACEANDWLVAEETIVSPVPLNQSPEVTNGGASDGVRSIFTIASRPVSTCQVPSLDEAHISPGVVDAPQQASNSGRRSSRIAASIFRSID